MYRSELPAAFALQGYRIEHVLAQGAFGITYRAHEVNLNRSVAIKEYLPALIATRTAGHVVGPMSDNVVAEFESGLASFINEAQTLAKFEHPNIVRVHSAFEANGTAYMVMQYEEGDTLSDILRKRGTLTEQEIMEFTFPLLSGLEAVHDAGFVHRDIKPANIFIRTDGTPILLDFGSARQALESHPHELTNLVTTGYAPIEQYTGKPDSQGPWTDIYGLAATLYRAITGRPPNDAVERGEAIANDAADTFQSATERAAGRYAETFLQAIDCALRFSRDYRPQSVAEWRAELTMAPTIGSSQSERAIHNWENSSSSEFAWDTFDSREPTRIFGHEVLPGPTLLQQINLWTGRRDVGFAVALIIVVVIAISSGNDKDIPWPVPTAQPKTLAVPVAQVEMVYGSEQSPIEPIFVSSNDLRIGELLETAADDVTALRLTTPDHANAYDKYRGVLLLDPQNKTAREGIDVIVDRYIALSDRSIGRGKFDQAEHFIQKAMNISANGSQATAARRALIVKRAEARKITNERMAAEELMIAKELMVASELSVDNSVAELHGFRSKEFLRRIGSGSSY